MLTGSSLRFFSSSPPRLRTPVHMPPGRFHGPCRYTLATLSNVGVLNISQDVGGIQGWRVKGALGGPQAWVRPLTGLSALGGHGAETPESVTARKVLASCCRHSVEHAAHVAVALFNGGESTVRQLRHQIFNRFSRISEPHTRHVSCPSWCAC